MQAQDSHYWSQQYGPRATMLGGAMVGGGRDNSCIFYNPGALGFLDNKNLSVSATRYELDQIKVPDGAGTGLPVVSRTLQAMPLIVSGIFKLNKYPRHTIRYCLLTRDQFGIKTSARKEKIMNVLNDSYSPGEEEYIGQYNFKSSVYEMLSGWAYGYRISDKISVGLGNYGSYRSLHADSYISTRALPIDSTNQLNVNIASFEELRSVEIKNVRTVFKLGFSVDMNKLKLGLAVTSPSINVIGWATVMEDVAIHNMSVFGNGVLFNFLASDRQSGLKSEYRTPLSVSIGAEYILHKTNIAFSAEWFDKVSAYNMVTPEEKELVRPSGVFTFSSAEYLRVEDYKRSVFNFSVAAEQALSSTYKLSVSFRTNQAFVVRDSLSDIRVNYTDWNINHLSLGITKKKEKSDLTVGIAYGFGRNSSRNQWVNLTEPQESRLLTGVLKKTRVQYESISLIIGYTYYFR